MKNPQLRSFVSPSLRFVNVDANEAFKPEPEELHPVEELIAIAEVSIDFAKQVANAWDEDAPDVEYAGILNAVEIED